MSEYHVPIMLDEVMDSLGVKVGGIYLDGTTGGGGHSEAILRRGGKTVCIDRDDEALTESRKRFESEGLTGYTLVKSDFRDAAKVLDDLGIDFIDGALLDLGISSHQIDEPSRGFSYRFDGRLDMRMDESQPLSAYEVVNDYDERELERILFTYGEERFARKIVANIVKERAQAPIETTQQLVEIIRRSTPAFYQRQGHPAKKTFQAIRIEVNGELEGLREGIESIAERIKSGGRFAIITFHSLEDRIVKQTFRLMCTDCICDKSLPVCVCGHKATAKSAGKFKPDENELKTNPRSASATLRVIEKL